MTFGYARVSTDAQVYAMQIDAFNKYGVDRIFSEKLSGKKGKRPELDAMLDHLREGDRVVIYALARLGRSTKDLLTLIDSFEKTGVQLISLRENIDTKTPSGRLLITVLSAIAEFERETIVERTRDGLQAARARGRFGGRPKADGKALEKAVKLWQARTHTVREITEITKIGSSTLYRELRRRGDIKSNDAPA